MKKQNMVVAAIAGAILLVLYLISESVHQKAAVASAHPLATQAGIDILKKGGNAFDAAVAVTAALAVVEPYGSGLGGGGFWLIHLADENKDTVIDARERAPLAATRDMFLDASGKVKRNLSVNGVLAAAIPGTPAALEHLTKKYGTMSMETTLQPAIKYARSGFDVDVRYRRLAKRRLKALKNSPAAAQVFLRNNRVPSLGTRIVQTDLAATLERMTVDGADVVYKGIVGSRMVDGVNKAGGIWSVDDLRRYRVKEREPLVTEYKGMKVTMASLPSSGGIVTTQMLNMLDDFNLFQMGETQRMHVLTEVMRRAYRDRAEYLGDSDFYDVPVEKLISKEYANELAATISTESATPSSTLKSVAVKVDEGNNTTHFSIIDGQGNRVAATMSINYPFGSGYMVEGTGVLLNNEMDDFSAKPGVPNLYGLIGAEANSIEPGKRMLSSMTPTFVEYKDRVAMLGTPGGSRIITMNLLAMLEFMNGGTATDMVTLKRFHHQYLPDNIVLEPGFSDEVYIKLRALGHKVDENKSEYGNMQVVITNNVTGKYSAASDPRGFGEATVLK